MKWLIILGLILVLVVIIARKYRRQIQMAIYLGRMFWKLRQTGKSEEKQISPKTQSNDVALTRCATCGIWVSPENALNLRSGTNYCSIACMEKFAKVN